MTKSARESALLNRSIVRPGKVSMPKEATKILVRLERAKSYGSKRKYNKELESLAKQYPEMNEEIMKLRWTND
jgi:hypothetical protein